MDEFKVPTLPSTTSIIEKSLEREKVEETNVTLKQIPQESKESEKSADKAICPYKIPNWSAPPSDQNVNFKFEVLKSGQIIEEIDNLQKQAHWMFGRLNENDIVLAHPTISRFHAVLQYRPRIVNTNDTFAEEENLPPEGWYIYDIGSTHGTFLNKQRIPAKVFIRIRVGHMLKLGASTRSYIFQGPIEDEEPESELSITELREQRERKQQEAAEAQKRAEEDENVRKKSEGISWGMSEDANEETDLSHNPYASSNNEDYFSTNPKMALRHFFEREDLHLEYKCDEMSLGSFVCRIDLPVDDENGRPITAEVVHKGKKKDCVFQCALEACRILDRLGVLRQKNQEPLARRKKPGSDSDDDDFLDRTGDIARKKERKANANTSVTLTYEDLLKQEKDLACELEKLEGHIAEYQAKQKRLKQQAEAQNEADLDSFMENLNDDVSKIDKTEIKKLRLDQQRLKNEQQRLRRLIKVAKPYELPFPKPASAAESDSGATTSVSKKQLPMIGKRKQFSKFKVLKPATSSSIIRSKAYASDEEEMDDDDNLETKTELMKQSVTPLNDLKEVEKDKRLSNSESKVIKKSKQEDVFENPEEKIVEITHTKFTLEEPTSSVASETESAPPNPIDDISTNAENLRKRTRQRQRVRINNKRQDVDVEDLDEHETSEKYAKWVPPANQTGDGFTSLNEKFGY